MSKEEKSAYVLERTRSLEQHEFGMTSLSELLNENVAGILSIDMISDFVEVSDKQEQETVEEYIRRKMEIERAAVKTLSIKIKIFKKQLNEEINRIQ